MIDWSTNSEFGYPRGIVTTIDGPGPKRDFTIIRLCMSEAPYRAVVIAVREDVLNTVFGGVRRRDGLRIGQRTQFQVRIARRLRGHDLYATAIYFPGEQPELGGDLVEEAQPRPFAEQYDEPPTEGPPPLSDADINEAFLIEERT